MLFSGILGENQSNNLEAKYTDEILSTTCPFALIMFPIEARK